jgi:hypothetical protein
VAEVGAGCGCRSISAKCSSSADLCRNRPEWPRYPVSLSSRGRDSTTPEHLIFGFFTRRWTATTTRKLLMRDSKSTSSSFSLMKYHVVKTCRAITVERTCGSSLYMSHYVQYENHLLLQLSAIAHTAIDQRTCHKSFSLVSCSYAHFYEEMPFSASTSVAKAISRSLSRSCL